MKTSTIFYVVGAAALITVGCVIIPPLIRKGGNKIYKASLKNEKVDYDDFGPEIVRKETINQDTSEDTVNGN